MSRSQLWGGVLFIDEAYALVSGRHENDFGYEAVDTLLTFLEDHREDLVVILAGYPDKMKELLQSNPGVKSRFNRFFIFPDYESGELREIFRRLVEKGGYQLTASADALAGELIDSHHVRRGENFGNARLIRNFFERTVSRHADRVAHMPDPDIEDLTSIRVDDLPAGEDFS
jgi:SpoVK/Ycf46/Vps4 family AAA+-type ATPase